MLCSCHNHSSKLNSTYLNESSSTPTSTSTFNQSSSPSAHSTIQPPKPTHIQHQQHLNAQKPWSNITKYNRNLFDYGKIAKTNDKQMQNANATVTAENGKDTTKGLSKRSTKFGRCEEDAMARASQILQ